MRKPRLSELKEHFQGHTATKEKRLDLNLRLHVSKAMSLAVAHVLAGEWVVTLVLLPLHSSPSPFLSYR